MKFIYLVRWGEYIDRITFDFEAGKTIIENDSEHGFMVDPDLREKREAILKAAGLETFSMDDVIAEVNDAHNNT